MIRILLNTQIWKIITIAWLVASLTVPSAFFALAAEDEVHADESTAATGSGTTTPVSSTDDPKEEASETQSLEATPSNPTHAGTTSPSTTATSTESSPKVSERATHHSETNTNGESALSQDTATTDTEFDSAVGTSTSETATTTEGGSASTAASTQSSTDTSHSESSSSGGGGQGSSDLASSSSPTIHTETTSSHATTSSSSSSVSGTGGATSTSATSVPSPAGSAPENEERDLSNSGGGVQLPDDFMPISAGSGSTAFSPHEGHFDDKRTATSSIATGNASAIANVANVVNTNITGSGGGVLFLNNPTTTASSIDLRPSLLTFGNCTVATCTPSFFGDAMLAVFATNTATVTNDVLLHANTGGNDIGSHDGPGVIHTGDAHAALNLVNLVNTNIVGSDFLLLFLNNFGDLIGDIILPGKKFFDFLSGLVAGERAMTEVANTNNATIENSGSAEASTGGNTAGSGGTIMTGDVETNANIFNMANTNLFGGGSVSMMLNVAGDWNGEILGLPNGLSYERTPEGVRIFATGLGSISTTTASNSTTTVSSMNTASVSNIFDVSATTGGNTIATATTSHGHQTHDAVIKTGDARAVANVVNIVNTNIYGSNWLMAFVNIFGDWNGNISFGQPDLFVGEKASLSQNPLTHGAGVSIEITVTNRGDTDATNVVIQGSRKPSRAFSYTDLGQGAIENGVLTWRIPRIASGDTVIVQYSMEAKDVDFEGSVSVDAEARSRETDANYSDNRDSIMLTVKKTPPPSTGSSGGGGSGTGGGSQSPGTQSNAADGVTRSGSASGTPVATEGSAAPRLSKTNTITSRNSGTTVSYKVVLRNDGPGSIYDAVVRDRLRSPGGTTLSEESWPLGTVYPNEEIVIEYDVTLRVGSPAGTYQNVAWIEGKHADGSSVASTSAQSLVVIVKEEVVEFQGTATPISSVPFSFLGIPLEEESEEALERHIREERVAATEPMPQEDDSGIFVGTPDTVDSRASVASSTDTMSKEASYLLLVLSMLLPVLVFSSIRPKF